MKFELGFKGERFIYLPFTLLEDIQNISLISDLYLFSLGYFSKANYHYINRPEGCDQYLLIVCKDGKGKVVIAGKEYTLSANQYIILPPHVSHQYNADETDPWSIYWFHFKGAKAEQIFREEQCHLKVGIVDFSTINKCYNVFEEIYNLLNRELTRKNVIHANFCFMYLLGCLVYIGENEDLKFKSEYNGSIINRSVYYMNQNINKKISLEEIAHFLNYSTSHFYRKFIKETGIAPMKYFTKMKMDKACDLLKDTNLKVNQVASLLGYSDSLYFSRVFSKEMGVSPEMFRKKDA